jgi:hypothetical protein
MARHDGSHDSRDFAPMTANLRTNADPFQQPQSGDQVQALQKDLAAQPAAARSLSHEVDASSSKVDGLGQTALSAACCNYALPDLASVRAVEIRDNRSPAILRRSLSSINFAFASASSAAI